MRRLSFWICSEDGAYERSIAVGSEGHGDRGGFWELRVTSSELPAGKWVPQTGSTRNRTLLTTRMTLSLHRGAQPRPQLDLSL